MFILRWISNILAPIGIILALMLVYFALIPLKVTPQPAPDLSQILQCTVLNVNPESSFMSDEQLLKLKMQLGAGIPIELVNEFAFGNVTNSLVQPVGSKSVLRTSYCTVKEDSSVVIATIEKYFENQKKYYSYGSLEDFIDRINSLPFAKISNFDLKVPSTFIRSTYCNQPVNNSDFYLFSVVPGPDNNNVVALFNINFMDDENAKQQHKYTRNLLETGQYVKSRLYCNG